MTEEEKAKELFKKFYILDHKIWQDTAKQCALITVNELIKKTGSKYWYNVKQELEKL